ncbi:hypothetical protein G6F68_011573 [Rhizopus microsporus]|nr:hypothetical protein G6F68_011573 [Rhizopus microsporus]
MNQHAVAPDIFDAARYPTATFKGKFTKFDGDRPEEATGDLTLRGVTRPVKMEIDDFKCIQHPMEKREVCGADVSTKFSRKDFGLDFGLDMGFKPEVELKIQVVADAAGDVAVLVFAAKLLGVAGGGRMRGAVGVAFQGDRRHRDLRCGRQAFFQFVVLRFAFCQGQAPAVVVHHDRHVVRVVE